MQRCCQIGPFPFRLTMPEMLPLPENLALFEANVLPEAYHYELSFSSALLLPRTQPLVSRPDLTVFQTGTGEARLLGIAGIPSPYAYYQELSPSCARVTLAPGWREQFGSDTIFTSLLALERRMIDLDQLVLHCAYVKYRGEAILFSAPSETGKTTQANLWERYRGAETVNGDRALLGKRAGGWIAQGWPVCGTSGVCHNETTPIRAIVMLSQAKENSVRRLKPLEAMRLVFGQLTVNRWNPAFTSRATDLALELCATVPVYCLGCTISEAAVSCLERALF